MEWSESGKGDARKIVLTDRPTLFADERTIPLSVLRLVRRMIVPPEESHEENEGSRGEDRIEFHGQRRRRGGTRHDATNVNDKCHQ